MCYSQNCNCLLDGVLSTVVVNCILEGVLSTVVVTCVSGGVLCTAVVLRFRWCFIYC